jgi:Ser/Thr protein kinase RdoA (MazF antagonist)
VVVETRSGRKVLKLYRPRWKPDTVECAHSILGRLEDVGLPAPRVQHTPEGATWIATDGAIAAVFDWIDGRNYSVCYLRRNDRLRLTAMAAQTLAGLHTGLAGFEPAGRHHHGFASLDGPKHRDVPWHAAQLEQLIDRSREIEDAEAAEAAGALTRQAEDVLASIEELDRTLAPADLPRLVIHGDFGLHNLLFRAAGPAVPVDFELSRVDLRVNDLISVLGKHRYTGGTYDLESMQVFMAAYSALAPLTADERRWFSRSWCRYKLEAGVQYWISYFDTDGPTRKLRSALDSIEQARQVADRPETIAALAEVADQAASSSRSGAGSRW